ncbi:hypothetical protein [Thermogemmatispora onikobensis]|uniref:hypothetical protein n=1 Tax=Thermogemmatispora onikobensis TaxID=732234 RepID=UPI00114CBECD|nr:hypothetical protein [Thermogemmatispora onikobensis]
MITRALRWSGVALVAGGLGMGAAIVLVAFGPSGRFPPSLVSSLLLVASLLVLLALPTMYAHQSEAAGWLGLVGYVLLEVGMVLVLVYAAEPLFTPTITGVGESAAAFSLGIALLLGFVLTAVATLRAGVYPRWSAILLLATSAGFLFDFFVAEELPPIAGLLDSAFLGVMMASAFGGIGGALWRGASQTAASRFSSPRDGQRAAHL